MAKPSGEFAMASTPSAARELPTHGLASSALPGLFEFEFIRADSWFRWSSNYNPI